MKQRDQQRAGRLFRIFLLCAFCLLMASCLSWILEKPSFVLRSVMIHPRSFTEMKLLIGLDVRNPNRFDLTLKSFECTVSLKTEEIGKGRLEEEIRIPSSSTTRVEVPIDVKFRDLGASLKAIFKTGNLPYRIEGTADIGTAFGSLNYSFSEEGQTNP